MNVKKPSFYKHFDFLLIDEFSLLISYFIAYGIYLGRIFDVFNSTIYRSLLVVVLLINVVVTYFFNPHKNILKRSIISGIFKLFEFVLVDLLSVSFFIFIIKISNYVSRVFIVLTFSIFYILSFIFRYIRKKLLLSNINSKFSNRLLILTVEANLEKLINDIQKNGYYNYAISGICVLDKNLEGEEVDGFKIVANKDDVLSYICHNWVDEVYIAAKYNQVSKEIFDGLATAGITTSIIMEKIEEFEGQEHHIGKVFGKTVSTFSLRTRTGIEELGKRALDILGGIVGSLITLLLTIVIGPMIYIKSPGPIFYKQERIGQNGRRFHMYKFRSMVLNADALKQSLMDQNRIKDGMMFKIKDDPRIIPGIGHFIRNTSLDEFPQFFNVLLGDMSLVGTRPPTVDEWVKYRLEHRIRMAIKPGITGMWQINGRSKIVDFDKVIEYDTKYINNWSLGLDVEILAKTVFVLLFKKREDEAM